jgi:hypothetical protein
MELLFLLLQKGLGFFSKIKETQESFRMVSLQHHEFEGDTTILCPGDLYFKVECLILGGESHDQVECLPYLQVGREATFAFDKPPSWGDLGYSGST